MSVTILECLQNAKYNLDNAIKMPMLIPMVKEQLNNAVELLDKGYSIWDEVEPLLEKYGSVEDVPDQAGSDFDIDKVYSEPACSTISERGIKKAQRQKGFILLPFCFKNSYRKKASQTKMTGNYITIKTVRINN